MTITMQDGTKHRVRKGLTVLFSTGRAYWTSETGLAMSCYITELKEIEANA